MAAPSGILALDIKMRLKLVNSLVAVVVAVSPLCVLACEFHSESPQTATSSVADLSSLENETHQHQHGTPTSPTDHHSPSSPEMHCIAQQHAVVLGQLLTAVDLQGLPGSELEVAHSGPVKSFTSVELPLLSSPKPVSLVLRI